MNNKYPVITLCGSTCFKNEFMEDRNSLLWRVILLLVLASLVIPEILRFGRIWMKER